MSEENVELVKRLLPDRDVDLTSLLRDERLFSVVAEIVAPLLHPEFESVMQVHGATEASYAGLDGLRAGWLDRLAPWATYRSEIEEIIDAGEQVVVLVRDFGRREGSTHEVEIITAAVDRARRADRPRRVPP